MENFNQILKNYFAGQGLHQSDIAIRLGLSRTIVNNYLNGQRKNSNTALPSLAGRPNIKIPNHEPNER